MLMLFYTFNRSCQIVDFITMVADISIRKENIGLRIYSIPVLSKHQTKCLKLFETKTTLPYTYIYSKRSL